MSQAEFTVTDIPRGDTRSPIMWVASHALRHSWSIAVFLSGALVNAALAAIVPIFVGVAITAVQQKSPNYEQTLWLAFIWIVLSQVIRGVWQLGRNFSAELMGQRIERDGRAELYASLLGKSMTFHSLRPVGEIMARATNDVRETNLMFNPGVNLIVGSANFLIMPVLIAPTIHPQLVLAPALFVVGYVIALALYMRELNPLTSAVRANFGKMNARLEEAIEGIETVKGAAREQQESDLFTHNARAVRDAYVKQGEVEARFVPLLLLALALALGFAHSVYLYQTGQIGGGTSTAYTWLTWLGFEAAAARELTPTAVLVSYNTLLLLFGFPTFISLFAFSQVSSGLAGSRRILELINSRTELDENPNGHTAPMQGAVTFENVDFGYQPKNPILQHVAFTVQPGQTIAVVGQTGAGKTSLMRLINRTYDVSAGRVLVDGVNVRDWNLASLRQQISIIEQDIFLFSRTIAENIAFGNPQATPEQIEEAARAAQAHDFIQQFKDGYNTVVGERGVMLSGGQRQRIALARAFLTNPRILILDDSTSAIDSATEDQIQRAIFRAAAGRTTFIITHRLSQIRWADRILVFKQGRMAAFGTHDELLRTSEPYRRIFARYEN